MKNNTEVQGPSRLGRRPRTTNLWVTEAKRVPCEPIKLFKQQQVRSISHGPFQFWNLNGVIYGLIQRGSVKLKLSFQ